MYVQKFRKLTVWQRSIKFVTFIYELTSKFPKEERFGLVDQIRRAALTDLQNASLEVDELSAMIGGLIKKLKADS